MNQAGGWAVNFYYDNAGGHNAQEMTGLTSGYEVGIDIAREDYRGFSTNTSTNYHLQGK